MKYIKKWWWAWAVSILALGTVVVSLYNPKPGPAVFDFNDGTVQGWTFDGVYSDAGKKFNGKYFPTTILKNLQGELVFFPNQLGLALNQAGFPKDKRILACRPDFTKSGTSVERHKVH